MKDGWRSAREPASPAKVRTKSPNTPGNMLAAAPPAASTKSPTAAVSTIGILRDPECALRLPGTLGVQLGNRNLWCDRTGMVEIAAEYIVNLQYNYLHELACATISGNDKRNGSVVKCQQRSTSGNC